jgi:hypothetical protein
VALGGCRRKVADRALAFFLRGARGERWAGVAVVGTIFVSAVVQIDLAYAEGANETQDHR